LYYIVCLFLVFSGIIIGQLFNESISASLNEVLGTISSIATILGLLLAYLTVNSWKKQFQNNKLDLLIDNLEDGYYELSSAFSAFSDAQLMIRKCQTHMEIEHDWDSLFARESKAENDYEICKNKYSNLLNKLFRHSHDNVYSTIKLGVIKVEFDLINDISKKIFIDQNSNQYVEQYKKSLKTAFDKTTKNFQAIRNNVLLTSYSNGC
jgi:hypothetical protein